MTKIFKQFYDVKYLIQSYKTKIALYFLKYSYSSKNKCSWKGFFIKNISIWPHYMSNHISCLCSIYAYSYTKTVWNNTTHICISVPLHIICYRVKDTQRNYYIFRGCSPRIFQLFCRNVKKREVRSRLNSGSLYTE